MSVPFEVGIVGSRRRNTLHDRTLVFRILSKLHEKYEELWVISGGATQGADAFAKEWVLKMPHGPLVRYIEFPATKDDLPWETEPRKAYGIFTQRAYARNRMIAKRSVELYALVAEDRRGGTENTIQHAIELGTPVFLVTGTGYVYLSLDGKIPPCEPASFLLDSSPIGSNTTS